MANQIEEQLDNQPIYVWDGIDCESQNQLQFDNTENFGFDRDEKFDNNMETIPENDHDPLQINQSSDAKGTLSTTNVEDNLFDCKVQYEVNIELLKLILLEFYLSNNDRFLRFKVTSELNKIFDSFKDPPRIEERDLNPLIDDMEFVLPPYPLNQSNTSDKNACSSFDENIEFEFINGKDDYELNKDHNLFIQTPNPGMH